MADIMRIAKNFSDSHRLLINLVMKLNAVRVNKVIEIYKLLCSSCGTDVEASDELNNETLAKKLVSVINKKFENGMLLIRFHIVPDDRYKKESYIVWVNNTKFVKELLCCRSMNNDETIIFSNILEYMFSNSKSRGEISTTAATGIGVENKLMKPKECDNFVRRLVADGVLVKNESRNSYSLHSRAILELENKLLDDFNVPTCNICDKLVVTAFTSVTCDICDNEFHNVCVVKLLGNNIQVKCPGRKDGSRCRKLFDRDDIDKFNFEKPVESIEKAYILNGVKNVDVDTEDQEEIQPSKQKKNRKKKQNYLGIDEDDIADDDEEDITMRNVADVSPIRNRKRKSVIRTPQVDLKIDECTDSE